MTDDNQTETNKMTVIDAKLPLSWLIGCAFSVVFSFGTLYMKLDTQSIALKDVQAKLEKRDDSMTVVLTTLAEVKTSNLNQDQSIQRNAADISEIKRQLEKR